MPIRTRHVSLVLFLLLASLVFAQHQRLGLAPQTIRFNGLRSEATVDAFCLDLQLYASESFVPYKSILNENSAAFVVTSDRGRIPLGTAMKEGLVTVEGSGDESRNSRLALKFARHSSTVQQIVFEGATAFGEIPGGLIADGSPLLKALSVDVPKETARQKNDRIWRAQTSERILSELGQYPDGPVNPASTEVAVRKFQEAVKLPITGALDAATVKELTRQNDRLMSKFSKIGFGPDTRQTKVAALSSQLRQFQAYHGIAETGRLSTEVVDHLRKDEAIAGEIGEIAKTSGHVNQVLASEKFPNTLTFYRDEGLLHALVQNESKLDYWVTNGVEHQRGGYLGPLSQAQFLRDYHEFISRISRENGIPTVSTDQVDEAELSQLANTKASKQPQSILVLVSPLDQGRPIGDNHASSVTEVARALRQHYGGRTSIYIGQDADTAILNAKRLPKFSGPQDLTFFIDGNRIDDRGILKSLHDRLETLDIDVIEAQEARPGQARVSVVVGKNDENFRAVLAQLAQQGVFTDGILALAKCGNADDILFNTKLIQASGAKAIIFYDEKIQPQAVKSVLLALTKRLTSVGVPDGDWDSLWRLSVRDAASTASGAELAEILKLAYAHIQTSRLDSPALHWEMEADS